MPECTWEGHQAAIEEAGDCPVCGVGDYDAEWAERNGVELEEELHLVEMFAKPTNKKGK